MKACLPSGRSGTYERSTFQHLRQKQKGSRGQIEIGGRRQGQEVWARWIDGRVQGDREFLIVAGLDPDTRFEDPQAFVKLIEGLLDEGSATVVLDVPPAPA